MKNFFNLKIALIMSCFFLLLSAKAQHIATSSSYDGIWAGILKNDNGDKLVSIIRISNGIASRYSYNTETKRLERSSFLKESSMLLGNNLSYTWMNKGGIWSETQTHMIAYLKPDVLYCRLIRQVNNASEDENTPGINNEWSTYYQGKIDRYESIEKLEQILRN